MNIVRIRHVKSLSVMAKNSQRAEAGSARIVILALVSFLLGVGVTILWFRHTPGANSGTASSQPVSATASPPPAPESVGLPAPAPTPASASPPAAPEASDPAVIEQVKKAVPNFASISFDQGEQILRAAALQEFADTTTETDEEIKRAQQELQDSQNSGSAADQQAAMKNVQDTQAAATERLKKIAANLQDQIAALKELKNGQ